MPIERHFLGWDQPCLHQAATWLRDKYGSGGQLDLSNVLIALPGARAGRRLLELLAGDTGLIGSPRIVTVGELPEQLYQPALPVADSLTTLLGWRHALLTVPRESLVSFVPQPPDEDDMLGWLGLAREMVNLNDELAAEQLTFASTAKRQGMVREESDWPTDQRWAVLDSIAQHHAKSLASLGVIDRNAARLEAVGDQQCATSSDVVLVGATDLNRVVRAMLMQVSDRAVALTHAPQSEAASFDEFGCVVASKWQDRPIAIQDNQIRVVDSPAEQAFEVTRVLEDSVAGKKDETIDPTAITVGLGDESLSPVVERTLNRTGLPTHSAVGVPFGQTRPGRLLAGLAAFADRLRLDDFAALLRHCDVEHFVRRNVPVDDAETSIRSWLTLLDTYLTEHLHLQPIEAWLGDEDRAGKLKRVFDAVRGLLPATLPESLDEKQPLSVWSDAIASVLRAIYEDVSLDDTSEDRQDSSLRDASLQNSRLTQLEAALSKLADALQQLAMWDGALAMTPQVTFADAIRFTAWRLASTAIAEPASDGVELLGWLELQLDDAPTLIVTGFNEGNIPASSNGDALLPNELRSELGLMHNDRRSARDAAALTAILHSRPHVTLIAGRHGAEGDPLMPSRLLLRCPKEKLPARVQRFYPENRPLRIMPIAWSHASENRLLIPPPLPLEKPFKRLHVTAFRAYLACPYRFYLRYVLGLGAASDEAIELDGAQFGNVMHNVLEAFGQHGPNHSVDSDEVLDFLEQQLADVSLEQFGPDPVATVQIQLEQMRQRLRTFAHWQVSEVAQGWRIVPSHTEKRLSATLDVDGETIDIVGRIDRIDCNESNGGVYRVLDYKTSETASAPLAAHCPGTRRRKSADTDSVREIEWVDLQLPLYQHLTSQLGITSPSLGYVRLSKDPRAELLAHADWNQAEIDDAIEQAKQVVRDIRAGNFWPPREPGRYTDEYSDLCLERHLGREGVIAESDPSLRVAARIAAGTADGKGARDE